MQAHLAALATMIEQIDAGIDHSAVVIVVRQDRTLAQLHLSHQQTLGRVVNVMNKRHASLTLKYCSEGDSEKQALQEQVQELQQTLARVRKEDSPPFGGEPWRACTGQGGGGAGAGAAGGIVVTGE